MVAMQWGENKIVGGGFSRGSGSGICNPGITPRRLPSRDIYPQHLAVKLCADLHKIRIVSKRDPSFKVAYTSSVISI